MDLQFLGGTGTVTGSKYLLNLNHHRYLVDCGLFQGYKELRLRNWSPLPFDPAKLDGVLLTHAHIDHSGYLPLLVNHGFRGPIYATTATTALCQILLPDSGHLQEEDAKRANLYGYSKHHPALPLYTEEDALESLKQFVSVDFNQAVPLGNQSEARWLPAGHILGAAMILIKSAGKRICFSGDLGRPHDALMHAPAPLPDCDYLVLESTYGNRSHDNSDPLTHLEQVIKETLERDGTVLIPAFAVGRTQALLYYLYQLKQQGRIPDLPIYLDSPMAIDATGLLLQHRDLHKLDQATCAAIGHMVQYINTPDESKQLAGLPGRKIIISASGMMTGGRILHHLKTFAPDPKNSILLTGFQAGGTRGDRLLKGEEELKIHGSLVPIRARIYNLANASAHADANEILAWLKTSQHPPKQIFITHGEPEAAQALKQRIEKELGWQATTPTYQQKYDL